MGGDDERLPLHAAYALTFEQESQSQTGEGTNITMGVLIGVICGLVGCALWHAKELRTP